MVYANAYCRDAVQPRTMKEILDADFLDNCGVRDFNYQLLQSSAEIPANSFLRLMELEDPSMPMLCPLVRALYYSGRPEFKQWSGEALRTIIVVDPDQPLRPSVEKVCHQVVRKVGSIELLLEFHSKATLIWAADSDDCGETGCHLGTLAGCDFAEQLSIPSLVKQLFELKAGLHSSPMGEPEDEGDFVGNLEYTLWSVNGLELAHKPTIKNAAHDLEFYEEPTFSDVSWPGSTSDSFSWMALVSPEDRLRLCKNHPELAAAIARVGQGSSAAWELLSVDDIQDSYRQGAIVYSGSNRVQVLMGCGTGWEPGWQSDESVDPADVFGSAEPPLMDFILSDQVAVLPSSDKDQGLDVSFQEEYEVLKLLLDSVFASS